MDNELKKLKQSNKAKIIILALTMVMFLGISLGAVYFVYYVQDERENSLTTGLVTVEFTDTETINLENTVPMIDDLGILNEPYTFTVKNTSKVPINLNLQIEENENNTLPIEAIRYALYVNDELIKKDNLGNKDENGNFYVYKNLGVNEKLNCKLVFWVDYYYETPGATFGGKIKVIGESFDVLYTEPEPLPKLSKTFKEVLLTRANSYVLEDDIYYVSGAKDDNNPETTDDIDFNYVWYSGKLWRITAIYPDGTMKMITDSAITTINWGATSTVSSSDLTSAYSTSYIREWLNQEFLPTLYNYENIIVEDAGWYSITDSASTPTKSTGDYTLTAPVGLLNAYEYYMSYKNTTYSYGYLNIEYYWWLITPYNSSTVRYVINSGRLFNSTPSGSSYVVRPSINLTSTIQLSGGAGTSEDPYRIKGDGEDAKSNITLLNTRQSGEYVKLSSDETAPVFRIVDTELVGEKLTTKVVLNDYVKENGTVVKKYFSDSSSHELWTEVSASGATYWRGYLNTTWLETLDTNMLEKGTYYLGYHTNGSYKTTVCSTVSSAISVKQCIENGTVVSNISSDDYVGLLRVGEMFASQTSDYTYSTASNMWLITPHDSSIVRIVNSNGTLNYNTPSSISYGVRPSINLTSTIYIKSGSGTKKDPFIVSLPTT